MAASRSSNVTTRGRAERLSTLGWPTFLATGWALAVASLAVAFLPFRRAVKIGSVPLSSPSTGAVDDLVWAVRAWSARLPIRTKCIEQGIALQRLLRQRGHDALLHYGAARSSDGAPLAAHVWITLDGETLIGGEQAADFAELAVYP